MPAPAAPIAPAVGGVVGHMLEHKRAVDLMVQDLTVPSTSAWNEGTAIYSELIQSCASCHALHHKVWGPRRQ